MPATLHTRCPTARAAHALTHPARAHAQGASTTAAHGEPALYPAGHVAPAARLLLQFWALVVESRRSTNSLFHMVANNLAAPVVSTPHARASCCRIYTAATCFTPDIGQSFRGSPAHTTPSPHHRPPPHSSTRHSLRFPFNTASTHRINRATLRLCHPHVCATTPSAIHCGAPFLPHLPLPFPLSFCCPCPSFNHTLCLFFSPTHTCHLPHACPCPLLPTHAPATHLPHHLLCAPSLPLPPVAILPFRLPAPVAVLHAPLGCTPSAYIYAYRMPIPGSSTIMPSW